MPPHDYPPHKGSRGKEVTGYFLTFTDDEREFLAESFEELGYELTPEGIKTALFQALHAALDEEEPKENATDRVLRQVSQVVKQNPEKVRMYATFAGSILKNVLTKK